MRENFLPIPDAPNYEINSDLVCRRIKDGKLMTLQYSKQTRQSLYSLRRRGQRPLKRSPRSLRAQAVDAVSETTFAPIPSLDNRYEINRQGIVRNAQTKLIIKTKRGSVELHIKEKFYARRAVADLLWEAHGKIVERRCKFIPCSIEKAGEKFFFKNLRDCARYLSPKVFYSSGWIAKKLGDRHAELYGWKVTYLDKDLNHNDFALADVPTEFNDLNKEARRCKRLDKLKGWCA